ncbi:MAG: flagellar basal body-associated FliL family protein [Pseudomonadota bacterium]
MKHQGLVMADDAPTSSEQKGQSKSGIIALVALVVVSTGSSFGASYFLSPGEPAEPGVCKPDSVANLISTASPEKDLEYTEIREIITTIGAAPADKYLKLNLAIATPPGKSKLVTDSEPILIDAFIKYLRAIETSDFENPDFYPKMRDQLSWRAELILGGKVSKGVLVTEFLLR